MTIRFWANINQRGDYNLSHQHRCTWAMVYYLAVPAIDGSDGRAGALEVFDPRPGATATPLSSTGRRFFRPAPGRMLVFPGWLQHCVHPFAGSGARVSIAANLTVSEAPIGTDSQPSSEGSLMDRLGSALEEWIVSAASDIERGRQVAVDDDLMILLERLAAVEGYASVEAFLGLSDRALDSVIDRSLRLEDLPIPAEALRAIRDGDGTE